MTRQVKRYSTAAAMAVLTLFISLSAGCSGGGKVTEVELKDFVVNLNDQGQNRFLKLKIKLVVEGGKVAAEIAASSAKISDALITFLSSKRVADLNTPLGKKVLKKQLIDLFNNKLVTTGKVLDMYYVNLVIQ